MNKLEAEKAVIGSILIDPAALRPIAGMLKPEHFRMALHQELYRAALALDRRGTPMDAVTIANEVRSRGVEVDSGYLIQLMDITPTAANVEEYAKLTRDAATRRGTGDLMQGVLADLEAGVPTQEVLGRVLTTAQELSREGVVGSVIDPEQAALRFLKHREAVDAGKHKAFVPTGYRMLDIKLGGGLLANGMYILAARPGMGKTTLAINIADRVAKNVGPVLFVSLEMDDEQLSAKRNARECGIPANRLLMDKLTDEECAKLTAAIDKNAELPMYISAEASPTVEEIYAMARSIPGLKLLIIDYFGKINPGEARKKKSRVEYTTEISGEVKNLARRLHIPVLLLAQLNREPEKRSDHRPQLSDLRETGAAEMDADGVIFLYRDAYYGEMEKRDPYMPEEINVEIAKNRHGGVGTCSLAFYLATSRVAPISSDPRSIYRAEHTAGMA